MDTIIVIIIGFAVCRLYVWIIGLKIKSQIYQHELKYHSIKLEDED